LSYSIGQQEKCKKEKAGGDAGAKRLLNRAATLKNRFLALKKCLKIRTTGGKLRRMTGKTAICTIKFRSIYEQPVEY